VSGPPDKGPRRLQLMPEVLPAPRTAAEHAVAARPSPRARTLARLSKLMAVAAAGAALAACTEEKGAGSTGAPVTSAPPPGSAGPVDTSPASLPPAPEIADAGTEAGADAGVDAGAPAPRKPAVKAPPPPPKRKRGYEVVDMLAIPARSDDDER
jgi:hypothetical protein